MKKACFLLIMIVPFLYSRKPVGLPGGLNRCYQNAAIQCLYAISELTDFIIKGGDIIYKPGSVSEGYCKLIRFISQQSVAVQGTPIHTLEAVLESEFCPKMSAKIKWGSQSYERGEMASAPVLVDDLIDSLGNADIDLAKCHKHTYDCTFVRNLFQLDFELNKKITSLTGVGYVDVGSMSLEQLLQKRLYGKKIIRKIPLVLIIEQLSPLDLINSFPLSGLKIFYYPYAHPDERYEAHYDLISCMTFYESGIHYTACVQDDETNTWYFCNDDLITMIGDQEMQKFAQTGSFVRGHDIYKPVMFFYALKQERRVPNIAEMLTNFLGDLVGLNAVLEI